MLSVIKNLHADQFPVSERNESLRRNGKSGDYMRTDDIRESQIDFLSYRIALLFSLSLSYGELSSELGRNFDSDFGSHSSDFANTVRIRASAHISTECINENRFLSVCVQGMSLAIWPPKNNNEGN